MSHYFTILCPRCSTTTTVSTGVGRNGTGIGQCRNCRKLVRVQVDHRGGIVRVT
ncbi:hypothetical protein [Aeromonas sobria]|uniref:hypothetical protein n=1 Tax=Aeromonas sobria TaxID=646 RepID=UPI0012FEAE5C|nr:hypothetical protein [Aeromonas sobria]